MFLLKVSASGDFRKVRDRMFSKQGTKGKSVDIRHMLKELFVIFGKKSVFWKWMLSYLAIMLILIICNGLTYLHSNKMLLENQIRDNDKKAEQIYSNLAGLMRTMEDLGIAVLVEEETNLLGRASAMDDTSKSYTKYKLYEQLNKYKRINGGYTEVLLYFEGMDYLVASNSANTAENYWRAYPEKLGDIPEAEWLALLKGNYETLSIKGYDDEAYVFFVKTIQDSKWDRIKINILFMYNSEELRNLLYPGENSENKFLLLNRMGENKESDILLDAGFFSLDKEDRQALLTTVNQAGEKTRLPKSEQQVYLSYYDSYLGHDLVLYWYDSIYYNSIRDYQRSIMLLLILSIASSILLMLYYLGKNYGQVTWLLDILKINSREPADSNEFTLIGGRLNQIQQNLKDAGSRLERQNNMFRKEYLVNLLKGTVRDDGEYVEELYGIQWKSDRFCCLLFYAEDINIQKSKELSRVHENQLDLELIRFILNNVYQELLTEKSCVVYDVVLNDVMALIVNFAGQEEASDKNIVMEATSRCREFLDTHVEMEYLVVSGEIHRGREGLSDSFQEAIYAMEMKRMYDLEECLFYSDLSVDTRFGYYYPAEEERSLQKQIQEGNDQGAEAIVHRLFEKNMQVGFGNTKDILHYLFMDIWCTLLKTLEENEETASLIVSMRSGFINRETDASRMQETLSRILQQVCRQKRMVTSGDCLSEKELYEKIVAYISQNLSDSTMSVSSIAEHFFVSSVEMSKTFRKHSGQKMTSYISSLRLITTKEMLMTNTWGLSEIADMAGFGSVRTLMRTFKVMEGMTPGQWREMQ